MTVGPPAPGDVPAVGQAAAMAVAMDSARESNWAASLEAPVLARLVSLGALEGIDVADHPLVWVVTSVDGRSELVLIISGTDGSIVGGQVTTIDRQ
jgi:hypothetical protein